MKFPKDVPVVVGWGKWAILPQHLEFSFSKRPLLYPKFVQIFQIGPKRTINFQGLASFWIMIYNQHKLLHLEI